MGDNITLNARNWDLVSKRTECYTCLLATGWHLSDVRIEVIWKEQDFDVLEESFGINS